MNTLKFYPRKIRENYERNLRMSGIKVPPEVYHNHTLKIALSITILSLVAFYFIKINFLYSILIFVVLELFFYFRINLIAAGRIKKMEDAFPDVISLMASNLRSGITIDMSFILSARPEFYPLDEEILRTGKDIATGKEVVYSLDQMGKRVGSEKITKTINLIVSGLRAGGNISDLLEQTSSNMKEKEFIEKRAASSILMYVIFIFFAIGIGAPILFSLSSVLIEVIMKISAQVPDISSVQTQLPFTFGKVPISVNFIIYFSLIFMIVTDFISCLVIGLVNKGEEREGLKFFIPIVALSLSFFFIFRFFVGKVLAGFFSMG